MSISPGKRLGDHLSLLEVIGQGAMGKVWLADDARHGRVAVKFMAYGRQRDPAAVARFEREYAMAATIESPHVVRMIELDSTDEGTPFIVMELVEGESLEELLERGESLSLGDIVAVLRQVGHALDAAHQRGIVHRDVKPENIILCPRPGGIHVKVLDFGLAKPWIRQTLTGSGVAMGTPDYMSPEQVLGGKHVDHRADLWALAVVAYRLLCGDFPFQADSVHALMFMICRGTYTPPSALGAPAILDTWFGRAFQPRIAERFQSAAEMMGELESALAQLSADDAQTEVFRMATLSSLAGSDGATRVRQPPADDASYDGHTLRQKRSARAAERHEPFTASDDEKTVLRMPDSRRAPGSEPPRSGPPISEPPAALLPSPRTQPRRDARRDPEGVVRALALVLAAMAVGFGLAAAWKHRVFEGLWSRAAAPRPAASPAPAPEPSFAAPPAPRRAAPSPAVSSSAPETIGAAFLTVECWPTCRVWVGKEALGLSPVIDAPVEPGKHRVVVYRDGVGSKILMIDLDPGERARYEVTMTEPEGAASDASAAPAEIPSALPEPAP